MWIGFDERCVTLSLSFCFRDAITRYEIIKLEILGSFRYWWNLMTYLEIVQMIRSSRHLTHILFIALASGDRNFHTLQFAMTVLKLVPIPPFKISMAFLLFNLIRFHFISDLETSGGMKQLWNRRYNYLSRWKNVEKIFRAKQYSRLWISD